MDMPEEQTNYFLMETSQLNFASVVGMKIWGLVVCLVAAVGLGPGIVAIGLEPNARFGLYPCFRAVSLYAQEQGTMTLNTNARSDPLWLLEKDYDWIPYRKTKNDQQDGENLKFKKHFIACLTSQIAAFGHHVIDSLIPYYGYPYYRVPYEPYPYFDNLPE